MKHIFTILLSIILLVTSPVCTLAQEAYAVMSPDSTTLTFYYDTKKASRKGTAYKFGKYRFKANRDEYVVAFGSYYMGDGNGVIGDNSIEKITTVIFDNMIIRNSPFRYIICAQT